MAGAVSGGRALAGGVEAAGEREPFTAIEGAVTGRGAPSVGGVTALQFLRRGGLAAGESILIIGASGAVGTMAVQLAKHMGAEVTAVCSGGNAELVRRLGADHVIDHTCEDFTRSGRRYDVIMDNHGNAPYRRVKGSLAPGGRLLLVVGDLPEMIAASWRTMARSWPFVMPIARSRPSSRVRSKIESARVFATPSRAMTTASDSRAPIRPMRLLVWST